MYVAGPVRRIAPRVVVVSHRYRKRSAVNNARKAYVIRVVHVIHVGSRARELA